MRAPPCAAFHIACSRSSPQSRSQSHCVPVLDHQECSCSYEGYSYLIRSVLQHWAHLGAHHYHPKSQATGESFHNLRGTKIQAAATGKKVVSEQQECNSYNNVRLEKKHRILNNKHNNIIYKTTSIKTLPIRVSCSILKPVYSEKNQT